MIPVRKIISVLYILAILAGIFMRFYGIGWGLPYHFHSDEHIMTSFAEKVRTTDSIRQLIQRERQFFLYSPFLWYPLIGLVTAASFFHPISPTDPVSQTMIHLLGRGLVACFSALTLILLYRLGRRLYGRSVGMLASVFLAFTVLHIRDSHFYFPDIPMVFFIVLTVYFAAEMAGGKGLRSYALTGMAAGLAMATKQTALLVLPVIFMAHCLGKWTNQKIRWSAIRQSLFSLRFWGLALVPFSIAGALYLAMNPFILMNPQRFLEMARAISLVVKGISQPVYTLQFKGTTFSYWFTNLLYFGMGPLLEIVCLAGILGAIWGCLWLAKDRRIKVTQRADWLILSFLIPYFYVVGRGNMKFIRYANPLLPFLCLLGARFLWSLYQKCAQKKIRFLIGSSMAAVILASLLYSCAYLNIYYHKDARIQASQWIHQAIPAGSTVLLDISYSSPLLGSMFFKPELFTTYLINFGRMKAIKNDYFVVKYLNLWKKTAFPGSERFWQDYLKERLDKVDFIIMGDEHYERYSHNPQANPVLARFYEDLLSNKLPYQLIKTFKTHPGLFGQAINDDRAELTFRLFDHPRVMIFAKKQMP